MRSSAGPAGPPARSPRAICGPGGPKLVIAKPTTFMNLLGAPTRRPGPVLQDPAGADHRRARRAGPATYGTIRVKIGGGEGGHNGLRSISESLSTKDYVRVRFGIGRPPGRQDPADYVLSDFSAAERKELDFLVDRAADIVESVVEIGCRADPEQVSRCLIRHPLIVAFGPVCHASGRMIRFQPDRRVRADLMTRDGGSGCDVVTADAPSSAYRGQRARGSGQVVGSVGMGTDDLLVAVSAASMASHCRSAFSHRRRRPRLHGSPMRPSSPAPAQTCRGPSAARHAAPRPAARGTPVAAPPFDTPRRPPTKPRGPGGSYSKPERRPARAYGADPDAVGSPVRAVARRRRPDRRARRRWRRLRGPVRQRGHPVQPAVSALHGLAAVDLVGVADPQPSLRAPVPVRRHRRVPAGAPGRPGDDGDDGDRVVRVRVRPRPRVRRRSRCRWPRSSRSALGSACASTCTTSGPRASACAG